MIVAGELRDVDWRTRLLAFGHYLALSAVGHLLWEIFQLPLYSIWATGSAGTISFVVLHCTIGDVLIAASVTIVALLAVRARVWPARGNFKVALVAIVIAVAYTIFSEWLNVYVRQSWSYSILMPTLPAGKYSIGLSPLVQWIVVPALVFRYLFSSYGRPDILK